MDRLLKNAANLLLFCVWLVVPGFSHAADDPKQEKIIGMYVHQHWPYNHPYSARTWTVDDWDGYADGLKQLGFNTIKIWPVLETMPKPLTERSGFWYITP